MSSAITQKPPCLLSNERIPKGFSMSKKRKRTNANNACHESQVQASRGIHTPIISSMTTFFGSSPHSGSSLSVATVPMTVATIMAASVTHCRFCAVMKFPHNAHITTATAAPAVPGPQGQ